MIFKTLLQKGAIAISVSAVAGMVYASQMQYFNTPKSGIAPLSHLNRIDTPPPGPDSNFIGKEDTTGYYLANRKVPVKGKDSAKLHYPISKSGEGRKSSFDLKSPVEKTIEVDSSLKNYKVTEKIGNTPLGDSKTVPYDDYEKAQNRQYIQDYFKRRSSAQVGTAKGGLLPKINLGTGTVLDKLPDLVDIKPQGSAEVIFSEDFSRVQNPTYSLHEQQNAQFKFDQKIQASVTATIGDQIKLAFRYDTQASFDFENTRKLSWEGKEDQIIKSIQVGDVAMPVSGSLITGSQSIFGVKTKLQFGKLDVTAVFGQEKSDKKEITLEGGAQTTKFNITADNYDAYKHYFLSQYFRDHFDAYNANWPALSNINITRVEVWVTNSGASTKDTRAVAGFLDLGEDSTYNKTFVRSNNSPLPDNNANNLYQTLTRGTGYRYDKQISNTLGASGVVAQHFLPTQDYYILENARQLQPTEFTYNAHLGYISLNQQLNPGDVMAVAFQYTIDGVTKQVGEFASDQAPNVTNPNVLFLKLIKSVVIDPRIPNWKLMMKNIYSLGAYQVAQTNFKFQVVYNDARSGSYLNYLPEPEQPGMNGTPIIRLLGMDKVNTQLEPKPDGNFDFLEGITITAANGRIIFPVVEPFGKDLRKLFKDQTVADKYVYQLLYDSTHTAAIQDAVHNKFFLVGSYQGSAGNEISLNSINVPQGSVKVFADGQPLTEGVDYTVDYNLGKVRIIRPGLLNSGSVIKVTSESNSLFSIQQKTLIGTHLDYHISKDFTVGGTLLHLGERPLTAKVNVGEEPINNTIFGFDGHYHTESVFLTELVNKIPLIHTKEKSSITAEGEYAQIIPGHPTTINDAGETGGVSYIDDFEGSIVPYDLRLGNNWVLASCPQGQPTRFPEANSLALDYGYRRAKLSWYTIDNIFFRDLASLTPPNIIGNNVLLSDPFQREVIETEVFPNEQIPSGSPGTLQTFDIVYRPKAKGPYNFDASNKLNQFGRYYNPTDIQRNWAGIQRSISTTDFELANIQYIEMWMMDPYAKGTTGKSPVIGQGEMYIDIGTISEDILHDNRESYENGLSCDTSTTDWTVWGRVPNGLHLTNAFDNDPNHRPCQDVGYDGLTDDSERIHFKTYLNNIKTVVTDPNAIAAINNDPSGDNFHFFRGTDYDGANKNIIERYMEMNGTQGNTPTSVGGDNGYGSQNPDDEDINHDFNIEKNEAYFEYKIDINPNELSTLGKNFLTDIQTTPVQLRNGKTQNVNWYQFKIPITDFTTKIGPISDFKSIRFMRIYFTGFNDSVILRFGRLQLVRGDWRKYNYSLDAGGDIKVNDSSQAALDVSAISLEANGKRPSIPYVIPPGIQRQIDYSTPSLIQLNEQSLDLKICGLKSGDSRAIFKNTTLDIRQYKTLKMFVHAESQNPAVPLQDGELHMFIRVGADFNSNYYEYEMPLTVTKPNEKDADKIWPVANQMKLAMQEWVNLKIARIKAGGSLSIPFSAICQSSTGIVTMLGNPDVGNVRVIMIGLRHAKDDNGPTKCAEVWIDELRVADFNEQGGWAATGRVTAKLADFGRIELTASRQTIGFGGLEQSLLQRNQSDIQSFGIISSFELGKFFPQKLNVTIPMFVSYSQQVSTPKYNPLSPDLPLASLTSAYTNPAKQDSVLQAAQDFVARKSLNFTGVQKRRSSTPTHKPRIYDIENFNATYIYSEIDRHNISNIYDNEKIYSGQLTYAFQFDPKATFEPFKKINSKYLKLISDLNFNYLPTSFSVTAKIDRRFAEKLYRNTDDYQTINLPLYDKTFQFNRKYDFKYNITKSLRLSYSAIGLSRIDEPDGQIDSSYKENVIWHNILKGGTMVDFNQSTAVDYEVPINKIPFLDFTSLHLGYTGTYEWKAAAPIALSLGNLIQNSSTKTMNGQLNFVTLYNKFPYLRNIISGQGNTKVEPEKKDSSKNISINPKGGKNQTQLPNQIAPGDGHLTGGETFLGILMSIRSVSFSYTLNNGTALPGFLPTPQLIGQNFVSQAPGLPFVFGSQADIRQKAVQNGWLSKDTGISQQYITTKREAFTGSIVLEPIKSLQIHVDFNRTQSSSFSEVFRNAMDTVTHQLGFAHLSPVESGNYSISILAIASSFTPDGPNNSNAVFDKFERNRTQVANSLASADTRWNGTRDPQTGLPLGYSRTNQDVLIPAFYSAYTGMPLGTTLFPQIPAPNWRLTYTGLSSVQAFKSFAKQISISSGYHATYSIDNYTTNLDYNPHQTTPLVTDTAVTNFISKYRIDRVTLAERFDPLVGIDVSLKSNWTIHLEYGRERQESFSFTNREITENRTNKYVLGAGYVTNKFYLPFTGRTKRYLKNEVKFRLDVSINDNKQVIRILDQENADATGGQTTVSILPNITYVLNKSLTLNIFFKRNMTTPYTSNQYPTSLTSIGFSLKYILTP